MKAKAQYRSHLWNQKYLNLLNLNIRHITPRRGYTASRIVFISNIISPLGDVKWPKEQKAIILPMLW